MYNGNKTNIQEQLEFAVKFVMDKQTDVDKLGFFYHHEFHAGKITEMITEIVCERLIKLEDSQDNTHKPKDKSVYKKNGHPVTSENFKPRWVKT